MSTIDPRQSLAFSVAGNPRVYALLLGSGVSRSAGIPTGWEMVVDLLAKLAATEDSTEHVDLEEWYRDKYGQEPEYSELIDQLARTPSERQQLLRPYFEPNEEEREQGLKQPTAAHRAVAQLVADDLVRVIITTNFDQLIETALRDVGITPTVLSTPDQVAGALPLIHANCTVFKVHGDYTDPRILNSPAELGNYDSRIDSLLDQIFDQFGLIVCGWSADWDVALRNAITGAPSRRFTTYWAARGTLGSEAQKLVNHRDAQVVPIQDADAFFREMQATVSSITRLSRPHPWSTQAAVETLKRYLTSRDHRIRLADHIDGVVRTLVSAVSDEAFPLHDPVTQESFVERLSAYESACSTLLAMAVVAGYWAEEDHFQDWERAIRQIHKSEQGSGQTVWLGLRNYPAHLLMYALGFGAVLSGRMQFLGRLLNIAFYPRSGGNRPVKIAENVRSDVGALRWDGLLPGRQRHYTPFSDWVHDVLKEPCNQLLLSDDEYSHTFDTLEILNSLSLPVQWPGGESSFRMGSFLRRTTNRQRILLEIGESIATTGMGSPFVTSRIFGQTEVECLSLLGEFAAFTQDQAAKRAIW